MMKVLNAKVDWRLDWGNDPTLFLEVDTIESPEELRYEHRDGLYYAQRSDGNVHFYAWSGGQKAGSGGSHFTIKLTDGSEVTLMGPWSSRAGVMNRAGFGPCVDVTIRPRDTGWLLGGAVTLAVAEEAVKQFCPGVYLYKDQRDTGLFDDITYRPALIGMTHTESKRHLRAKAVKV